MYDVFNNAWNLGGKLFINFNRYLMINADGNCHMTESIYLKKQKYEHRGILPDITLRVGVVASFFSNIETEYQNIV